MTFKHIDEVLKYMNENETAIRKLTHSIPFGTYAGVEDQFVDLGSKHGNVYFFELVKNEYGDSLQMKKVFVDISGSVLDET